LENLNAKVDINRDSETVTENIKFQPVRVCYYELKKHRHWFNERCSELLDQRKQAKLQWLQNPSEINGDNLNNIHLKPAGISGMKRGDIEETKLMSLQRTVRTRTLEICIEE
jgi:hypothetical protein